MKHKLQTSTSEFPYDQSDLFSTLLCTSIIELFSQRDLQMKYIMYHLFMVWDISQASKHLASYGEDVSKADN